MTDAGYGDSAAAAGGASSGPGHIDTLIYIRHGQTDWNVEGRLQGQRDIPLNAEGRRQARRNGHVLAEWLDREGLTAGDFDWVASPLARATETIEIVRASLGLDPQAYRRDPELKEIRFGAWEGATLEEIARQDPARHQARLMDKWRFAPPGGESYAMLAERIGAWLEGLRGKTVCVAHGAVHRVVRRRLEGFGTDLAPALDVPQDRIYLWRGCPAWI